MMEGSFLSIQNDSDETDEISRNFKNIKLFTDYKKSD